MGRFPFEQMHIGPFNPRTFIFRHVPQGLLCWRHPDPGQVLSLKHYGSVIGSVVRIAVGIVCVVVFVVAVDRWRLRPVLNVLPEYCRCIPWVGLVFIGFERGTLCQDCKAISEFLPQLSANALDLAYLSAYEFVVV